MAGCVVGAVLFARPTVDRCALGLHSSLRDLTTSVLTLALSQSWALRGPSIFSALRGQERRVCRRRRTQQSRNLVRLQTPAHPPAPADATPLESRVTTIGLNGHLRMTARRGGVVIATRDVIPGMAYRGGAECLCNVFPGAHARLSSRSRTGTVLQVVTY